MVDKVSPIARPQSFTNPGKGNRDDASTKRKSPQKQDNNLSTTTILFPDVMRALLEEQAKMNPIMLQNEAKNFFKVATAKYETSEQVIQDPLVAKHHLQNFIT